MMRVFVRAHNTINFRLNSQLKALLLTSYLGDCLCSEQKRGEVKCLIRPLPDYAEGFK